MSPISSLGIESDWNYGSTLSDYNSDCTTTTSQHNQLLDQLAGSLADELTLENDFLLGSVLNEWQKSSS